MKFVIYWAICQSSNAFQYDKGREIELLTTKFPFHVSTTYFIRLSHKLIAFFFTSPWCALLLWMLTGHRTNKTSKSKWAETLSIWISLRFVAQKPQLVSKEIYLLERITRKFNKHIHTHTDIHIHIHHIHTPLYYSILN